MRKKNSRWKLTLLSVVFLFAAGACSWADNNVEYEPYEGQPGKDVVWVPTPQELVDKMLEMAKVTPEDYVIDLGSGDGRMVITAAKMGIKALGIEYNADLVALSKINAARERVSDKASFIEADIFETDFSDATVITMFLLPGLNLKLRPQLLDLKPGTRIVSNSFSMGDWVADKTVTIDNCDSYCTAYLWIIPAKVEGDWDTADGKLTLSQRYQMLSGRLESGGKNIDITGMIDGYEINFSAEDFHFSGKVMGNSIEGTALANGKSYEWKAARKSSQ